MADKKTESTKAPKEPTSVEVISPEESDTVYVTPSIREFLESEDAVKNLKDLIGLFMGSSGKGARWVLLFKAFCFSVIVGAIVILSMTDNFSAAVAFAFGTLAGYIFGTNNS